MVSIGDKTFGPRTTDVVWHPTVHDQDCAGVRVRCLINLILPVSVFSTESSSASSKLNVTAVDAELAAVTSSDMVSTGAPLLPTR